MAKSIFEWSRVAAENNFPFADGGMPEGMDRQQLNDSARERMRALRELYETVDSSAAHPVGLEWLDLMRNPTDQTAFTVTRLSASVIRIASGANDMSAYFNVGRRIRTYIGTTVTDSLFVASVSYSNPNTDVTIRTVEGQAVTAGIDGVKLHSSPSLARLAFSDSVSFPFTIPAGLTNSDFDDALATIASQGGGIIFLLGGTHVLTSNKDIDHPIWILGQGVDYSTIKVDDGADLNSIFTLHSTTGNNMHFSNFSLDGNRALQTAGDGDGFLVNSRATHISFRDMVIYGTRRDGIRLHNNHSSSDINNVSFDGLSFSDIGGDGIGSVDDESGMYAIQGSKITVDGPGQEETESAGIRVAGQWNLSDITVTGLDLGGGNTQRGIWFLERLAIDPSPQDAHLCNLVNFNVSGTGANARGLECHGERNMIANGTIKVSGAVSRGVLMGGTLGQQTPSQSRVQNVLVEDANIGVLLESSCSELEISALTRNCTTGIDVSGDQLEIVGCRVEGGTTGIDVKGTCTDVVVEGNKIAGQSGNGVNIVAGATGTVVRENTFRGVAGSDIVDAGTDTIWGGNYPAQERSYTIRTAGSVVGPADITGFIGLAFPGLGGNGTRKFLINATFVGIGVALGAGTAGGCSITAHLGPLGTSGDPAVAECNIRDEASDASLTFEGTMSFSGLELTPAAGNLLTFHVGGSAVYATAARPAYCTIEKARD